MNYDHGYNFLNFSKFLDFNIVYLSLNGQTSSAPSYGFLLFFLFNFNLHSEGKSLDHVCQ